MASQTTYLAAILCLYSLSEFVLSRTLRERVTAGSVVLSQGLTLLVVCLGSAGFLSPGLAAGLAAALAVRGLLEILLLRKAGPAGLLQFAAVQAVTLILLAAAWHAATPLGVHGWYAEWEGRLPGGFGGITFPRHSASVLLTVAAYGFMVDGGSKIVRGVLDRFPLLMQKVSSAQNGSGENRGEWIGILERIITLTFVLTGSYTAVAFTLTAKSIARFKELDDRGFAEYYLLGTSTSVAVALIVGALIRLTY